MRKYTKGRTNSYKRVHRRAKEPSQTFSWHSWRLNKAITVYLPSSRTRFYRKKPAMSYSKSQRTVSVTIFKSLITLKYRILSFCCRLCALLASTSQSKRKVKDMLRRYLLTATSWLRWMSTTSKKSLTLSIQAIWKVSKLWIIRRRLRLKKTLELLSESLISWMTSKFRINWLFMHQCLHLKRRQIFAV